MTITIESLNEYQSLANRTNNYADTHPTNPRHRERKLIGAIGLIGEVVEVLEVINGRATERAKLQKELGDVAWYIATLLLAYGIYMDDLNLKGQLSNPGGTFGDWANEMVYQAKNVSELVKKEIGHDHAEDRADLLSAVSRVFTSWHAIIVLAKLDPMLVLAANIEKLASRYPGGFDAMRSMKRVAGDV